MILSTALNYLLEAQIYIRQIQGVDIEFSSDCLYFNKRNSGFEGPLRALEAFMLASRSKPTFSMHMFLNTSSLKDVVLI